MKFMIGLVCQTKESEYNWDTFKERIKWDHFKPRILQGDFLTFVSLLGDRNSG